MRPKLHPSQLDPRNDLFGDFPDDALATYLMRLPFNLALDPSKVQTISLSSPAAVGGTDTITVEFRFLRLPTGGTRYFPQRLTEAASAVYGVGLDLSDPDALYAPDIAYETWVSAETPLRHVEGELQYPARTLERSLQALWLLMTAYRLSTRDLNVFPVGPASVNKWTVVGVRVPGRPWQQLSTILMRPEAGIPSFPGVLSAQEYGAFQGAVGLVSNHHPFLRGKDLELAARRQAYARDDLPAAEVKHPKGFGRIRLKHVPDVTAESLLPFIDEAVETGTTVHTDGYWKLGERGYEHERTVMRRQGDPAHVVMPGVHRVVSPLQRWLLGTHHGRVSHDHLDAYLNEFTFRFNRRNSRRRGLLFYRLLETGGRRRPDHIPQPRGQSDPHRPPIAAPAETRPCRRLAGRQSRMAPKRRSYGTT
jgi:transposase-like protein